MAVPLYDLFTESGENALRILTRIVVCLILTLYIGIMLVITKMAAGSGTALRRFNKRLYQLSIIEQRFQMSCNKEREFLLDHFLVITPRSLSFMFLGSEISLETAITVIGII